MSRILNITYPFNRQGTPHQAMGGMHLARSGVRMHFLAWGNGERWLPEWIADCEPVEHELVPKKGVLSAVRFLVRMFMRCRARDTELIYVQGAQHTPFALIACLGIPSSRILYHTQDFLEPGRHRFYEFFERRFARRAGLVICNEENRARFMKSYYKLKSMPAVIRTALPKDWPRPERDESLRERLLAPTGLSSDEARLIAVGGGYSPVRCTEQLIEALRLLPSHYRLVFTGLSEEGHHALQRHGVAERAIVLDRLPFQELLRHYAVCDVGMLLYANDGIGNYYQAPGRLTEYMSVGLPFVASAFPNFELLALKFGLGAVCDSESPESIAAGIQKICSGTDEERYAQRVRLRELSEAEFSYETQAACLEEIINVR